MPAAKSAEVPELHGPPRRVSGLVSGVAERRASVGLRLARLGKGAAFAELRARVAPFGQASELQVRLPPETPPGTYSGTVALADGDRSIRIKVLPELRLRIHPRRSRLTVRAGEEATLHLAIANVGNVAWEIPPAAAFGLFEVGGADSAVGAALRAELPQGEPRLERLMEELRGRHGGLVRVDLSGAAGTLEPGATREIGARLAIPSGLAGGRTYSGVLRIGNLHHGLALEVEDGARARGRAGGSHG
jgi:hypothetical protein